MIEPSLIAKEGGGKRPKRELDKKKKKKKKEGEVYRANETQNCFE
jgi:hypothetical protein